MISRRDTITAVALLATSAGTYAEIGRKRSNQYAARPRLKRGVNFHHLLNWPEMTSGPNGDYVWPPFGANTYSSTPVELKRLFDLGVDFIRMTVNPGIYLMSDEQRRREILGLVEDRTRTLLASGFSVIVDFHPVAQIPRYAPDRLMVPNAVEFQQYSDMLAAAARALTQFPPERVVLELINEPSVRRSEELVRWQSMLEHLHAKARLEAPRLPLMLTGGNWSGFRELMALDVKPFKRSNVMYTFHYYNPHVFTHQAVPRHITGSYVSNLVWPARSPDREAAIKVALEHLANNQTLAPQERKQHEFLLKRDLEAYFSGAGTPGQISEDFSKLARWADSHGIARRDIVLGEFGANRGDSEKPLVKLGRLQYIAAVRKAAEQKGFPWAIWAYRGSGMALAREDASRTLYPEIIEALGLSKKSS